MILIEMMVSMIAIVMALLYKATIFILAVVPAPKGIARCIGV